MKIFTTAIISFLGAISFAQVTPIYTIQGNGASSPLETQVVTTEGVVFADFQLGSELNGFYIQDTLGDGDAQTSDGIFIYSAGGLDVNVGDYVSVTGTVVEYYGLTEIGSVTNISVLGSVQTMIQPTSINLPVASIDDMEAFEGMYVTFPQNLVVTEHYNLGQYGEFTLATDRLTIPTNTIDPNDDPASGTTDSGSSNVTAVLDYGDLNDRSMILVDDGRTGSYPNPIPYINPVTKSLVAGTDVQDITGALSYGFSKYRLMPTEAPNFNHAQRMSAPNLSGDVTVASFNVLNFFATIDNGVNDARGADSQTEYIRQRDKIVAALDSMRADIFALIEIENNGTAAADSLVAALNNSIGSNDYALVTESPFTGSYAIKNVFIYNTNTVLPIDTTMTSTDPLFYPPPIAHQFEVISTGARFNVCANHYRYKGCADATGLDLDQNDGQGCYNETRRQQSFELLDFMDSVEVMTGNDKHLIVGDFNAYEQEDPIDIWVGAGYTKLLNDVYTYVYQSEFGSLDHAFASPELASEITGSSVWTINSNEPRCIDYNEESVVDDLYEVNPYRSSDHDPIVIGLSPVSASNSLSALENTIQIAPNPVRSSINIKGINATDFKILDASGRVVLEGTVNNNQIDVSKMVSGVYLLQLDGQFGAVRFVKE